MVAGFVASAAKNLIFACRLAPAALSVAARLPVSVREIRAMSKPSPANLAASERPRPSPAPTIAHTDRDMRVLLSGDGGRKMLKAKKAAFRRGVQQRKGAGGPKGRGEAYSSKKPAYARSFTLVQEAAYRPDVRDAQPAASPQDLHAGFEPLFAVGHQVRFVDLGVPLEVAGRIRALSQE